MATIFFYGLFMDKDLLREKGLDPGSPVISYIENYDLRIGERATLLPAPGKRSYGTVMTLNDKELNTLYGEDSVADYRPEPVNAITLENLTIPAIVYNLPMDKVSGHNSEYLRSLIITSRKIGLPEEYIQQLESLAHDNA